MFMEETQAPPFGLNHNKIFSFKALIKSSQWLKFLMMDSTSNDLSSVIFACNFAAVAHRNQLRKDNKTPYINHPIGVAHLLTRIGGVDDPIVIQGALLHDTVEDTETTLDDIELHFGKEVRKIVDEVSDDKSLSYQERKRLQIEHAPHISRRAKLIKLADKLYNLRDLCSSTPIGWTQERVQQYFEWAAKVIKGLQGTNEPLERELKKILATRNVLLE